MYDRMHTLTREQKEKIHSASMQLLEQTGIAFSDEQALSIFQSHGFKVDGTTVFFSESQIRKALETVPERFTVHARNPDKDVVIGEGPVFVPGYGAPFLMQADGTQRSATMQDYDTFCKLIHSSKTLDMNGWMMVEPHDMPPETVHLDMNRSTMLLCDKPFMGSPLSRQGALEGVEMAGIVFGGKEQIHDKTVSVSLINSLSPLRFASEMTESLIVLAEHNQACVIASLIMAGASGPVTLEGVLVLQNAEILAGITLTQLVRPGAPVIYGSTSSAIDMRTGALSIGAPELSKNIHCVTQMARFYNIPSRSGGGLTDAPIADAQAGLESALALSTAVRSGAHFMLHSCGILGAYAAMSFEKFLIDEEACALLRAMTSPLSLTDDRIDLETIQEIGIGGLYLSHPKTFKACRTEFFMPALMCRQNTDAWTAAGSPTIDTTAGKLLQKRLAAYEKPAIDPALEKELNAYVTKRKEAQ